MSRASAAEILHGGHLDVGGVAFEHISWRARPFGDRDVVGEVADAGGGGAPMRREDEREAEGLRRLHGPQAERGGVARTRPSPSTCLTVSLSGVPGAAAP